MSFNYPRYDHTPINISNADLASIKIMDDLSLKIYHNSGLILCSRPKLAFIQLNYFLLLYPYLLIYLQKHLYNRSCAYTSYLIGCVPLEKWVLFKYKNILAVRYIPEYIQFRASSRT